MARHAGQDSLSRPPSTPDNATHVRATATAAGALSRRPDAASPSDREPDSEYEPAARPARLGVDDPPPTESVARSVTDQTSQSE